MKELPTVTVVVPSLNRAHFLVATLESILRQDYPHIECIVIDGGSHDGTLEILKQYGDRIKWVSERDGGHADAVNKGWKAAKGEILTWLNVDDCYAVPHAVRVAVERFQTNPQVDFIYGDYKVLAEDGSILSGLMKPRQWDLEYAIRYCHYTVTQPASFIRRSILEKVGLLDPEVCHNDDHELWLRIGLKGNIQYVPVFLAYTRRCQGLCQSKEAARAKVRTTEKILSRPDLPLSFQSRAFRKRAMSNAYLMGAVTGVTSRHFKIFLTYLAEAAAKDLSNFPHIFIKMTRVVLALLLPNRAKWFLRRAVGAFQRIGSPPGSRPHISPFQAPSAAFPGLEFRVLPRGNLSSSLHQNEA